MEGRENFWRLDLQRCCGILKKFLTVVRLPPLFSLIKNQVSSTENLFGDMAEQVQILGAEGAGQDVGYRDDLHFKTSANNANYCILE